MNLKKKLKLAKLWIIIYNDIILMPDGENSLRFILDNKSNFEKVYMYLFDKYKYMVYWNKLKKDLIKIENMII